MPVTEAFNRLSPRVHIDYTQIPTECICPSWTFHPGKEKPWELKFIYKLCRVKHGV